MSDLRYDELEANYAELQADNMALKWQVQDLDKKNQELRQAIEDIICCYDNDYLNRLEDELNRAEELL